MNPKHKKQTNPRLRNINLEVPEDNSVTYDDIRGIHVLLGIESKLNMSAEEREYHIKNMGGEAGKQALCLEILNFPKQPPPEDLDPDFSQILKKEGSKTAKIYIG